MLKKLILPSFIAVIFVLGGSNIYSQQPPTVNALLEFCTGTWCQYCPCGDQIAENILINHPYTVVLAYHGGGADPFKNFNGNEIIPLMGFNEYPTGVIGRQSGIQGRTSWPSWVSTVEWNNGDSAGVKINVTKSYDPVSRALNVTANVTSAREIDTICMISLVISEDNVVYFQQGNEGCPGGLNYVHKWITRNMVDGALGDTLSNGTWAPNTTHTKSWITNLDPAWVDSNSNFQVFVYYQSSFLNSWSYILQSFKNGVTTPVGIINNHQIVKGYSLSQNYPNPFNPTTNIKFSIATDGNVSLKIYDVTGAVVQTYLDGFIKAGSYNAEVDGSNLASGVYFYTLSATGGAAEFMETKKMIIVK